MRRLAPAVCLAVLPVLGGCAPFGEGCEEADVELVEAVMETAREDFTAGGADGVRYSRLELRTARAHPLPDELHEFGMSELLALDVVAWAADEPEDSPFAGTHVPLGFAVSEDHRRFVPVEELAATSFAVEDPVMEEDGFDAWAGSVEESDAMGSALDCVRAN